MSGPKLSAAEIEAQRKAQLERERQERLRRLRDAQSRYNNSKANVADLRNQLVILLNDNISSIRSVSPAGAENLMTIINQLLSSMEMYPIENSASEEAWISSAVISQERALKLLAEAKAAIDQEVNRIGLYSAKAITAAHYKSVSTAVENAIREDIQYQNGIEFSPCPQDSVEMHLSSCLKELRELLDQKQVPMLQSAAVIAKEVETILSCFERGQAKGIEKKAQDIINREQDLIDEIEECKRLYDEYCAFAAIVNADPRDLSDFTGVELLEKEIHELKCCYQKKDEMDYIADQINQVMLELGYEFVSSHVLQQEQEKDLSLYGAGEEAGVEVYTGENGEVMMQVVSIGNSEELSEEEKEDSLDLQLSFCASHQDIVEELRKRGVLLRQVNYQPPRREYAKKICTSDYSSASRGTVTRRKRRYEPRKAMRKL